MLNELMLITHGLYLFISLFVCLSVVYISLTIINEIDQVNLITRTSCVVNLLFVEI